MVGTSPEIVLFLLQWANKKYFKDDNPIEAIVLLVAIAGVISFSVLYHILRNRMGGSVVGKGQKTVIPRKFNFITLRKIASVYSLNREQTKLLEFVFRNDAVADPERVMKNPLLLDRHFKRAYRTIERTSESEEDAQQRLVKLFNLRNVIESAPGLESASTQLGENMPVVLKCEKVNYPVKVLSSRGQNVVVEFPRNALGTPVRLETGTRISLSFFNKANKGFSFDGHVLGTVNTDHGPGMQLTHTGKLKPLVKRQFRRKETAIRCELYFVNEEQSGKGRNQATKLVVDSKKYIGNVLDVSIGGCSIKTTAPVQVGSRLKISIDYDDNSLINVLGQVLRTNRSGSAGTIVHIKFLKVPRRAFNSINALVFGYSEE